MSDIHEGGCLCGAVRYRVEGNPEVAYICHCTNCKRYTGSAFGISVVFSKNAVQIIKGNLKMYEYRSDETSRWIKLEFCPNCGTAVTGVAEVAPSMRVVTVGTFDNPNWVKPQWAQFTRSALQWVVHSPNIEIYETNPKRVRSRQ
jgi:hypothetical protein